MELNKNLKTPKISNAFHNGVSNNQTSEKPFYNSANNSIVNAPQSLV